MIVAHCDGCGADLDNATPIFRTAKPACYVFQGAMLHTRNKVRMLAETTTIYVPMTNESTDWRRVEGDEVCDFCGAKPVVSTFLSREGLYPVASFGGKGYNDDGQWAACETCRQLVRDGDRDQLRQRAQHGPQTCGIGPLDLAEFHQWVVELHGIFWDNYIGEMLS